MKPTATLVRLVLVLLAAFAFGCTGDLTPPWEVKKPRIILARVEVDGDTTGRTRPSPGETFRIRTFLASPSPPQNLTFAASLCLAVQLPNGDVLCVLEVPVPDLDVAYTRGDDALLSSSLFTVQDEFVEAVSQLGDLAGISLFAAACVDGAAERVPDTDATKESIDKLFRCTDNDSSKFKDPMLFTFSISFDFGEPNQKNLDPTFACSADTGACAEGVAGTPGEGVPGSILFEHLDDDAPGERIALWTPIPADADYPAEGCADSEGLVQAFGADEYRIRVRFDPEDRESFVRTIRQNGGDIMREQREDLLLSHAFTEHGGGSLDGFSSLIDREAPDSEAEAEIDYTPPKQSKDPKKVIPDGGKLVKFFFAVRDGRGGVDYTTRALCLLPPRAVSND